MSTPEAPAALPRRIPPMPQDDYAGVWAELTGYVQEAVSDGGVIQPADMLSYLAELKRKALAPVREWMDLIRSTPERDLPTLAQIAYEAYGDMTDGKNYQGLPMPEWAGLPPLIKAAWNAAVNATVKAALDDMPDLNEPAETAPDLDPRGDPR